MAALMIITPAATFAKGFSCGSSRSHLSYSSHSSTYHSSGSFSRTNGTTYHSGFKSASSTITSQARQNAGNGAAPASKTRGILTHAAAFGAGALLGSMFHPFGGGHSHASFSLLGFLLDLFVIAVIISVVRKLFFKRG